MNYEVGTVYTYLAIKRKSRLHVQHFVGKWNEESSLEFWKNVAKRLKLPTSKYRLNICTDGNKQNISALQEISSSCSVNYGQVHKIKIGDIVVDMVRRNILGNMPKSEISIRHIDGYCARIRERISRYCRRAKTYSKKKTPLHYHLCIFQAYNNFIQTYTNKKTPCMIEGIVSRIWDWNDFFRYYYQSSQ